MEEPTKQRYYRKVIRIRAEDSPNVRYALAQKAAGLEPTNEMIVPGVLSWDEYEKRRQMWDKIAQCVSLDAEFYEGAEVMMYPPEWLSLARKRAYDLMTFRGRIGAALGVDPAEGGDKTAMSVVDKYGLLEMVSKKTPDTSIIPGEALAMARKWDVAADNIIFDRGGGGKEHADVLRRKGYPVRTVSFGETIQLEPRHAKHQATARREVREVRYTYKNRRAQMYHALRLLLSPAMGSLFGLPGQYKELFHQLRPIPLKHDEEGTIYLPPKQKRDPNQKIVTLVELIGHSPDEADSLVLAIYGMQHKSSRVYAGAMV